MRLVSVVTPTYNRADLLPRAIESVINQTYSNLEHIIVDDGSTDDTKTVVRSYDDPRIQYLKHDVNMGQAASRNTAIDSASGDYIAFLDSDDEWKSTKLEQQTSWFEQRDNNWIGVYCDGEHPRTSRIKDLFTSLFPYKIRKPGSKAIIRDILTMQGSISPGSSLMIRTELARKIGGFDESMSRHEDLDFVIRLLQHGKFGYIDENLYTVYESDDPSHEVMIESKKKLLSKHANKIKKLEQRGYSVRCYHHFHLARSSFSDGCFFQGLNYLKTARASNPRQYISLLTAIAEGLNHITLKKNG
jgi:glycosyltransferase involved in cell wall biosynthesis